MSYQQQSLTHTLAKLFHGTKPFESQLSHISFDWDGPVSIAAKGYYKFIEFFIRKFAHFSSFGLLGLSIWFILQFFTKLPKWHGLLAVAITAGFACLDEFHQSLTPGRTPLIQDVILDTIGATVFVGIGYLIYRHFKQKGKHHA
jgi:VanZ family protein